MNGCNENAIEFMTNGTKATLTFSQGRYKSVIRKLAENFSSETVYRGTASADGRTDET